MTATKPRRRKPADNQKVRTQLRTELMLWLMHAHSVMNELIAQPEHWRKELARDDSLLTEFITRSEAANIECALESAISHVASVLIPVPGLSLPDPMGVVNAARSRRPGGKK